MKSKNDENNLDYIVVCLCRGLAEYDANEIMPSGTTTTRDDGVERHNN
jgi:hypothetical protein